MSELNEQEMQRVHDTLVEAAWATPPRRPRGALRALTAHYEAGDWEELDGHDEVYYPVILADLAPIMNDDQLVESTIDHQRYSLSPVGEIVLTDAERVEWFWEQVEAILLGEGDADVYPACSLLLIEHSDGRQAVVEHTCGGYSFTGITHQLRGPYLDESQARESHGNGSFCALDEGSIADEEIIRRWRLA